MLLGLCWRVLLDTQIKTLPHHTTAANATFPFALTEDERPRYINGVGNHFRQALLAWVQSRVAKYNIKVDDFVTSFSNGMAFLALIDSQKSGAVDMKTVDEVSNYINFHSKARTIRRRISRKPSLWLKNNWVFMYPFRYLAYTRYSQST